LIVGRFSGNLRSEMVHRAAEGFEGDDAFWFGDYSRREAKCDTKTQSHRVRQAIYRASAGRWRNLPAELWPLLAALNGL